MGSEAVCNLRYAGRVAEGKALLESREVIFRGEFRLHIPFSEITSVQASDGVLSLGYGGETVALELGRQAGRWAEKIRNPRGLIEKLGVKPGMRVAVLGVDDPAFSAELVSKLGESSAEAGEGNVDLLFCEADEPADLEELVQLRQAIKPAGAIWVVSPKGKGARVKDTDVMDAARDAGLVDNKVVSFSSTHTAVRLVIPKSMR